MSEPIPGMLLVAFATSLGWGLRGEWGHWWGATVPGASCGMATWLAFGAVDSGWQSLRFGATLAVSTSLGGILSYGRIVGYVKSEHDRSPLFGSFALLLVGGLWGFFVGTALGLLMTDTAYRISDLATWAVAASLGAFLAYKLLVVGLDLHLSPPRSDAWAAVLGGCIATVAFFWLEPHDMVVLRTAALGWLGFGGGFVLGALIHRRCTAAGWRIDSWKFMEHSVGFWGGLALGASAWLMGRELAAVPASDSGLLASAIVVLWWVPYMNISDNFQYWFLETRWIGRRTFVLFQALSLASLPVFAILAGNLVTGWEGSSRHDWPFLWTIGFMTFLGISKYRFDRSKRRLVVDGIFAGEAAACVLLLLVI